MEKQNSKDLAARFIAHASEETMALLKDLDFIRAAKMYEKLPAVLRPLAVERMRAVLPGIEGPASFSKARACCPPELLRELSLAELALIERSSTDWCAFLNLRPEKDQEENVREAARRFLRKEDNFDTLAGYHAKADTSDSPLADIVVEVARERIQQEDSLENLATACRHSRSLFSTAGGFSRLEAVLTTMEKMFLWPELWVCLQTLGLCGAKDGALSIQEIIRRMRELLVRIEPTKPAEWFLTAMQEHLAGSKKFPEAVMAEALDTADAIAKSL